jgi:lantibiotic modifying enzyme
LISAAKRLSQNELRQVAGGQMSAVIRRAKAESAFHLMNGDQSQICDVGFLKEITGIGYTCLRLADFENVLPSILLME